MKRATRLLMGLLAFLSWDSQLPKRTSSHH